MKTKLGVYKDLAGTDEIDPEVSKAQKLIISALDQAIVREYDFVSKGRRLIEQYSTQYRATETFGSTTVMRRLIPDISSERSKGYFAVTVIACEAEGRASVIEAIKKADISTPLDAKGARKTMETVVVLSPKIGFIESNVLRRELTDDFRRVMVYSVKNGLGVAKHAVTSFANLYRTRAKKLTLLKTIPDGLIVLQHFALRVAKVLGKSIESLKKAFVLKYKQDSKHQRKRERRQSWLAIQMARALGVRAWFDTSDLDDFFLVQQRLWDKADAQGIDLARINAKNGVSIV